VEGVVSSRLLWNLRKDFATAVSDMSVGEIFGIKGNNNSSWDCLCRQFLIIDVLSRYKQKCVDFNVNYAVIEYDSSFVFIVDDTDFTAVNGDILKVSIEDGYFQAQTIDSVTKNPDIETGLYAFLLGLGYSDNIAVISFTNTTYSAASTGTASLYSNYEISFDQRELTQEDLDCLIEKIC